MKISTSRVNCYKSCKKLYFFKYIEELEYRKPIEALESGKSYHSKIEELYEKGWFAVDEENPKVSAMALAYEKYIFPKIKIVKPEEWFEYQLDDKNSLVGRYDGIAEDGCVVEHKSTSSSLDEQYIYNLQWDEQVLNYMLASGKNVIHYTVCQKPTIRQKKNETNEEFLQRCIEWYGENTSSKIGIIRVERSQDEVGNQKEALKYIVECMQNDAENDKKSKTTTFYRNPCYCNHWGRRCEYSSICLDYNPELQYVEFKKNKKEGG